jgi:FlaA1/EpsC-like NDP-sugar epimerase
MTGAVVSSLLFYAVARWGLGLVSYPRSVYVIDFLLLVILIGGCRLVPRFYREYMHAGDESRVLIYGAGDAGEAIVRSLTSNPFRGYRPIGFVDDDAAKTGRRIHGVQVLGTREQLPQIMAERNPNVVLIAISNLAPITLRQLVRVLSPYKSAIKVIPNLHRLLDGKVELSQIRNLAVEDLLRRAPVQLRHSRVEDLLTGKRIIVTGAGGSIGSELCRQVAASRPASLILYERYENSLFAVHNELRSQGLQGHLHALIGDITDEQRLHAVMRTHRPQIVLHAAAHKHVPLMESSPCEAVKNNVGGTRVIAQAAHQHNVERFIMISTDKAVNPSSVMGASKRVAEMVIQEVAHTSRTSFAIVRFGNVLGSNGSVVPLFIDQIKSGGPVAVTHPEVQRYFMLIPEAVQLVLQAATLAETGAVYVLDMGDQIKVAELARDLIRLSGHIPDSEIPIQFVGLRPGEKLSEELVGHDELAYPSSIDKILSVRAPQSHRGNELSSQVATLLQLADIQDSHGVIEGLRRMVPTFQPTGWNAGFHVPPPARQDLSMAEQQLPSTKLGVKS